MRFLSIANVELAQAIEYYEHQLPGLGIRLFNEIDNAVSRIVLMPQAWSKTGTHSRRCLINGFPYGIYYVAEEREIIVTAIAHLHRDPQKYENRII